MRLAHSRRRASAAAISMIGIALAGACSDGPTGGEPVPAEIRLLSQPVQSGTPGWPLPDSVIVEVLDLEGNPLSGGAVSWTADNDADMIGPAADTTNAAGRASAQWTLGRNEGTQSLSITAGDLPPVRVTATATIFHAGSVAVGYGFACALGDGGRTFCWGSNYAGQLGNGTVGEPVAVPAPVEGDAAFTTLTASGAHACGLTAEGRAYCWGSNESGETGTGTVGLSVRVPTPVQTTLQFTSISADGVGSRQNSTCALTAAGEAWCWGNNEEGRLGDGTTSNSAVPVRVESDVPFATIVAGSSHSCATATTGELWCWGRQESTPGAFSGKAAGIHATPVLLHQEYRFVDLVLGWNYACGLTVQGAALCWGTNWFGGLGSGDYEPSEVPLPVVGGHVFVDLSSAGYKETHGLTTDGVIYRWGRSGTDTPEPTPLEVTDFRFRAMESGEEPFDAVYGACGLSVGDALYCVRDEGRLRGVPAPAAP